MATLHSSTSQRLASLLALALVPRLVQSALQVSFFEHSSCNAGTSIAQYESPTPLQADTTCHQIQNGTVALYVDQIDDGCTLRIYLSTDCDSSASSLAGLLIGVGTCFYVEEGVDIGSWRPDCANVDYSTSNGNDTGNSYSNGQNDGGPNVQSALTTATGALTLTPLSTSTSMSTETPSTAASTTTPSSLPATSNTASGGSGSGNPTTTGTSAATGIQRGWVAGLMLSVVAISAVLL